MDQLLNQLPHDNPRHIGWRGIALVIVAIVGVVGFLFASGGFNKIANIFGSKAGTESTFVLAGLDNLSNSQASADWMVKDVPASFNGTGAFSDFANVPPYIVAGSLDTAFIMPLVSSVEADTFTDHTYASAPINIGQTNTAVNNITIYAHPTENSTVLFGYRTADAISDLNTSELHELTPTFSVLPENAIVSRATIALNREMKQYLQLTIDFHSFESIDRPVVYGWVVDYGQAIVSTPEAVVSDKTELTLVYSGGPSIPVSARIELLSSELAINPIYNQDNVNLQQADSYIINTLKLPAGAYTVRVTGPTIREKIVPFLVEAGDLALTVRLEAFEVGASSAGLVNPDLNGDGKINSLDAQILFDSYSQTPWQKVKSVV